ncbi:MAG: hypothetical protein ACKVOQ_16655 [Cyclobacteriaceae bacterium]
MYKALHLSPMIPSYNLEGTATFFKNLFDFKQEMDTPTYAILNKDGLSIHLLRAGVDIGQMEFYLEVDDVDVVWNSIKNKLEGIKVKEPFDRDYGMREIHIGVPHTNALLFVGSMIICQ